jgi:hypothetical protein
MDRRMTEATETLIGAYEADLQRQLGRTAVLERLSILEGSSTVTIAATLRIGASVVQVARTGDNVVTAYAALTKAMPELMLAVSFRQLVEA